MLNSVIFDGSKYNNAPQNIADQELAWLTQELQSASASNDQVLIASHIPSGNGLFDDKAYWRSADAIPFHQLLSNYKNIIIGILFGHTHMEELKILQNTTGNAVGAEISIAALSTGHGNAPAIKTFYLNSNNGTQWSVSNYTTFNFSPNLGGDFSLSKLYDFASYYCPAGQQDIQNIFQCLLITSIRQVTQIILHTLKILMIFTLDFFQNFDFLVL
ncbi:hypothetical protein GAMM_250032 [Gammaproteobacteria bacterium]